jgi:Na+-translocating ferredoxin:NAD+ oxidoreductase RNF subunit RnfB
MSSERDLGFLEGMIEGEGYIGLNKSKSIGCKRGFQWKPVVSISNDNLEILHKLRKICNGGYLITKNGKKREFRIASNKIREILPRLNFVNKKKQASLILKSLEMLEQNKRKKNFEKSFNDKKLEEIHYEIKRLNS